MTDPTGLAGLTVLLAEDEFLRSRKDLPSRLRGGS